MTDVKAAIPAQQTAPVLELVDDSPETVKTDLRKFNKTEDQVNKAVAALSTVKDIKDAADLESALDIIKRAKKVTRIIDEKRKTLGEPYREAVDKINAHAKKLTDKLPDAIKSAEEAVLAYNRKLEEERIVKRTALRIEQLQGIGFIPMYEGEVGKGEKFIETTYAEFDLRISARTIMIAEDADWTGMVQKVVDLVNQKLEEKRKKAEEQAATDEFFGETPAEPVPVAAPVVAAPVAKVAAAAPVKGITKRWTFDVVNPALVPREYLMVDESKIRAAMNAGVRDIPGVSFTQTQSLTSR